MQEADNDVRKIKEEKFLSINATRRSRGHTDILNFLPFYFEIVSEIAELAHLIYWNNLAAINWPKTPHIRSELEN